MSLGLLFVALAGGAPVAAGQAGASAPAPTLEVPELPPAESWSDRGLEPELTAERGEVRVRLILRDQDLLAAAIDPDVQAMLQTAPAPSSAEAAARHPHRISAIEKANARVAEGNYEDAVDQLQPAADASGDEVDRVAARVRRSGGQVLGSEIAPAAVIALVPAELLGALEGLGSVGAIEAAPEPQPQSSIGWRAVGADSWHAAGFTGGTGSADTVPADAGVMGELPDPTHPAFAGTPVYNDPGLIGGPGNHGTHTAAIIASGDAINLGVAYGLDKLVNGDNPYQLGFTYLGVPGAPDPAEVVSESFGSSETDDDEGDGDDAVTATFGLSQALSAGNENVDGSPTVQNMGRNTMSVGAFNDVGTIGSTDDVVLGVSSRGPTPAGRKKPDLTAPGGSVVSADSNWNSPPANPDYTPMSGTSFASPHVAGAMALLEGAGITDPMVQRALLINSARDWNGTNTGLHGWTAPQTGWRPEVGWGRLDLAAALAQRADYQLGSVSEGEARFYRATVPAGAKATLAFQSRILYVGYPGPPFPVQTIRHTQSNLDLHQYRSDDSEVAPPPAFDPPDTTIDPGPDAIDPNDTVEQVRSPATPGAQQITYKVQSASTIDGATAEPFAIAAAAPLTPLASPTVRPDSLGASSRAARCNQPVTITTTARNDSPDLAAGNAALQIDLPPGAQLVSGAVTQPVSGGTLATSATSEGHTWTVAASGEGAKTVTVRGAGDAYGTTFHDADQVTVMADCTPPGTSIDAGPSGPTNDRRPSFAFSGSGGPDSYECSIDGGTFTRCSSPFTTAALDDGDHSFRVRALDAVGNADPAPPTRAFIVDTRPPETAIESGPAKAIRSRRATFTFAGASAYECRHDGAPFEPCSNPMTLSGLTEGRHKLAVRAIDDAGNVDATPAERTFAVDRSVAGARIRVRRSVRFRRALRLRVRASLGERGSVRVRAVVKARRAIRVKAVATELGPGRVKLELRAGRAANRAIAAALRRGRVGLRVAATFTDRVGNARALKRRVRLRSPR